MNIDLFENIQDPVISIDRDGNIVSANKAFYATLNYKGEECPKNIKNLYADESDFEKKISFLKASERIDDFEVELLTSNGEHRYFSDSTWKNYNFDGNFVGYTCHLSDLKVIKSLRAQVKLSELNYKRLFELINSSITIVNEVGRIVNINKSAERLYGYSRTELAFDDYDKYFKIGSDRKNILEIIEETREHGGRYIEIGVPRKNKAGTYLYTYTTYFLVELDQEDIFVLFIMEEDITPRIRLEKKLKNTIVRVKETQAAAIIGFAKLTEYRDHITGEHLERMKKYVKLIAQALKNHPKYSDYINDKYIEDLILSSVLHDIGKVGIEDSILMKKGKLDKEEYKKMKDHCRLGGEALKTIDQELGRESFLTLGREIAYFHHERWDGTGYPEGRKGNDIPLSARIISIADVYDALTSKRPYKDAFKHEQALEIISEEKGSQFDPDIVDVFIRISNEIKAIREQTI